MNILNRKGLELAIGTVAIIALVLVVLVVVGQFFLGGVGEAGGGISLFAKGTAEEANRTDIGLGIRKAMYGGECKGEPTIACDGITIGDYAAYKEICRCMDGCFVNSSDECEGTISDTCKYLDTCGEDVCNTVDGCDWIPN